MARCKSATTITQIAKENSRNQGTAQLKTLINSVKDSFSKHSHGEGLLKDLEGQVTEALSKDEFFRKWGVHYLPSLGNAHLYEVCNNFKDPGVQFYGGELFKKLRDNADEIFIKLPPPKASRKTQTTKTVSSMASYHNTYGGCFHGDSKVHMSNGSFKKVKEIRKGDQIFDRNGRSSTVACVVKLLARNNEMEMVTLKDGLCVTPFHPVSQPGQSWDFPLNLGKVQKISCEAVYDFVLDSNHSVMINDMACVTFGHQFTDSVATHSYFGSQQIVNDLKEFSTYADGLVTLPADCFVRDQESSLITGMNKAALL